MNIALEAKAVKANGTDESNTTGADTNNVDVVLADGNGDPTLGESGGGKGDTNEDGKDVARSGYIIKTPVLSATKTSCVYNDPVNGTSNPKRIPGANIMYVINIHNNGTGDANDVNITDEIRSGLLYSSIKSGKNQTGNKVTLDENVSSACSCPNGSLQTSGNNKDNSGTSPNLKVDNVDIQAGTYTCISFTVEID
jgi:uncharacterized repeat protein (TIGR01451 family)